MTKCVIQSGSWQRMGWKGEGVRLEKEKPVHNCFVQVAKGMIDGKGKRTRTTHVCF